MSSMFGGGFKASKCKTLLRLAMARIKLLRNKRDIQVKQMRKDIAQLLSTGQEPSARIRVEHIAREQNIMAAYDIIELFCELIIVRLPIIESQKVCPMDLKEAVSSLIFASPRCADLPELLQIRALFTSKYGKEFVAAAAELRPECGVNRRIIEKLSVRAPSGETKLKLLTEIAEEHNVSWDPSSSEAELLKQPEDLLDGPKNFFGPSQTPISDVHPSPPKVDESVSQPQKAVPVRSQAPPAPAPPAPPSAAPPVEKQPPRELSSSDSEEDSPPGDKRQFIPFVAPVNAKGIPSEHASGGRSIKKSSAGGRYESSVPSTTEDPYSRAKKEGHMVYGEHADYDTVAAAAKAAAESADRAVAAARAAAELAKTHPSKRESLNRSKSQDAGSSSEEDSGDEQQFAKTRSSREKEEPPRHEKSVSFSRAQDTSDDYYRRNVDDRQEAPSRSNSGDRQEGPFRRTSGEGDRHGSFSRRNSSGDRPGKGSDSMKRVDSEETTFWRSGDQDWRQAANLMPEKKFESGGFLPNQQESLRRRDSDLFKSNESEDIPPRRSKERDSYRNTSNLFGSSGSSNNLFKGTGSEEMDLRSSDEAPFYDSKPGFTTPKFDEEELPYGKTSNFSNVTDELSFRRDLESPRSKPSFNDFWRTSSLSHPYKEGESRDYGSGKSLLSGSYDTFEKQLDEPQGHGRGASDPLPNQSYYKGEDAESVKYEDLNMPSSPIPTKSRRTRKGRDSLDSGGGSGGLPPPPGRPPKFSSSENFESSAPHSPDFHGFSERDHLPGQKFDESQSFTPKTSLSFYNSPPRVSAPPEQGPPSATSSAYQSPETARDSSPSVVGGSSSSRSSPSLDRKDSPSAPPVHPKLPDYDDLTARFEALKGKARR